MRALLLAALLVTSAHAHALGAATAIPVDSQASLHAVAGVPEFGMGVRVPIASSRLALLLGASLEPAFAAPSLDLGAGYVLPLAGPLALDAALTAGIQAPLLYRPTALVRAEATSRAILRWKYLRIWTGPELGGALDLLQPPLVEAGPSWVVGGQVRLWILEVGVTGALGARSFFGRPPHRVPPGFLRPHGRLLFSVAWVVPDASTPRWFYSESR